MKKIILIGLTMLMLLGACSYPIYDENGKKITDEKEGQAYIERQKKK